MGMKIKLDFGDEKQNSLFFNFKKVAIFQRKLFVPTLKCLFIYKCFFNI